MKGLIRLPSPGLVVAVIALIAALGGTSYAAATKLPKKSVGSAQVQNNAVTGKKISNNAVTSAKIKDGSLLLKDFKPGQLPKGPKGDTGVKGPKGDAGTKGKPGDKGDKGDRGPVGPTFGFARGLMPTALPGTGPSLITDLQVNVPVAGRLMIFGQAGDTRAECAQGVSCVLDLGIYVDGQPIRGGRTYAPERGGVTPDVLPTIVGLTNTLEPGSHVVELRFVGRSGGFSLRQDPAASLAAVALGTP